MPRPTNAVCSEELILGVLAEIHPEYNYGLGIISAIETASGGQFTLIVGTLYAALKRMKADGLIEDQWEDPEAARVENRPARHYWRITEAGFAVLKEARKRERAFLRVLIGRKGRAR